MKTLIFFLSNQKPGIQFQSFNEEVVAYSFAESLRKREDIISVVIHYTNDVIEVIK